MYYYYVINRFQMPLSKATWSEFRYIKEEVEVRHLAQGYLQVLRTSGIKLSMPLLTCYVGLNPELC